MMSLPSIAILHTMELPEDLFQFFRFIIRTTVEGDGRDRTGENRLDSLNQPVLLLFLHLRQPELMTNQSPALIFSSNHVLKQTAQIKKGSNALKDFQREKAISALCIVLDYFQSFHSSLTLPRPSYSSQCGIVYPRGLPASEWDFQ